MLLKDHQTGDSVQLTPLRYQFADFDNEWDANWLTISGNVITKLREWEFEDPSLLNHEASSIATWLERVAAKSQEPTLADGEGGVWPSLYFTEPNLALSVESYAADSARLRVHLSAEALPEDLVDENGNKFEIFDYWVPLEIRLVDLAEAATKWRQEISLFPVR